MTLAASESAPALKNDHGARHAGLMGQADVQGSNAEPARQGLGLTGEPELGASAGPTANFDLPKPNSGRRRPERFNAGFLGRKPRGQTLVDRSSQRTVTKLLLGENARVEADAVPDPGAGHAGRLQQIDSDPEDQPYPRPTSTRRDRGCILATFLPARPQK